MFAHKNKPLAVCMICGNVKDTKTRRNTRCIRCYGKARVGVPRKATTSTLTSNFGNLNIGTGSRTHGLAKRRVKKTLTAKITDHLAEYIERKEDERE